MKRVFIIALAVLLFIPCLCHAQVGGNASYGQRGGKDRAEQSNQRYTI